MTLSTAVITISVTTSAYFSWKVKNKQKGL